MSWLYIVAYHTAAPPFLSDILLCLATKSADIESFLINRSIHAFFLHAYFFKNTDGLSFTTNVMHLCCKVISYLIKHHSARAKNLNVACQGRVCFRAIQRLSFKQFHISLLQNFSLWSKIDERGDCNINLQRYIDIFSTKVLDSTARL